jgi:MOSC domain-containing protein YiiM
VSPAGPRVTAVCSVHALIPGPKSVGVTAIDKRPVPGWVEVGPLGLADDRVCDTEYHGGLEQAVYAYADEDADWWAEQLQREIPPGLFGENLRTAGIDLTGAVIGERWRVGAQGGSGGVVLQVTAPRIPCITFAERMAEPHWIKRFSAHGAPGAYLAVVEPGALRTGDPVTVESRPAHGVTIADTFLRGEAEVLQRLLDADGQDGFELTPRMRRWAGDEVARATGPSTA